MSLLQHPSNWVCVIGMKARHMNLNPEFVDVVPGTKRNQCIHVFTSCYVNIVKGKENKPNSGLVIETVSVQNNEMQKFNYFVFQLKCFKEIDKLIRFNSESFV